MKALGEFLRDLEGLLGGPPEKLKQREARSPRFHYGLLDLKGTLIYP